MQRTLITGANGFVGQQLCKRLQQAGHHVIGVSSSADKPVPFASETLSFDIRDSDSVDRVLSQTLPTHIVHLAAITHIPKSFEAPRLTWQTNVMGSINLLEAIRTFTPNSFVLFVSSADVYGAAFKQNIPLDEEVLCLPQNPYAASKLAAETAFYEYFRRGIRGVVARPFNHIGPHQSPDFVTASFAQQVAMIEAGKQEPVLRVGDLQASRDFLDVADVCRAYEQLLQLSDSVEQHPRCFNICSGHSRRIAEVLESLIGMSKRNIDVQQDPARMRPSDIPYAVGDSSRLRELTGWEPENDLQLTLTELLDYWRAKAATA